MSDVCISQESNLLHVDRVVIAGYECTSGVLYVLLIFCSIAIQIARNFIWTKTNQRRRLTLQTAIGSKEREGHIRWLLWYNLISWVLYIISFLLILGANLGFMISQLVGNLLGVYYSLRQQDRDKKSEASTNLELEEMSGLLNKYMDCPKKLKNEREIEDIRKFRELLARFLMNSDEYQRIKQNNPLQF